MSGFLADGLGISQQGEELDLLGDSIQAFAMLAFMLAKSIYLGERFTDLKSTYGVSAKMEEHVCQCENK